MACEKCESDRREVERKRYQQVKYQEGGQDHLCWWCRERIASNTPRIAWGPWCYYHIECANGLASQLLMVFQEEIAGEQRIESTGKEVVEVGENNRRA